MSKTNRIILISVFVSLLVLGIGYAAIQNITLTISGFAEVGAKAENFNVKFLENVDITKNGFDNIIVDAQKTSDITGTINLSELSKAGETVTVVYTIKNESPDLSADLKVSTTNDSPEYLTISSQLEKTSLRAGEETTVEVIVTVAKTPITENIKAKIGVELIAMPVQPGEEGTSDGINDFDQTPDDRNEFGYYYDKFYINSELGIAFISHADYSCEGFRLMTKEKYPFFEKDEWICVQYWKPGERNPEIEIANGATVANGGKKIVCSYGDFVLSDIIPHGIYLNNEYKKINENGVLEEIGINLDNGYQNMKYYNEDGNMYFEETFGNPIETIANGYAVEMDGKITASFNVTGDVYYIIGTDTMYKLDEIHNYTSQIIKEITCDEEGEIKYICDECDNYYTIIFPPHNHKNDYDLDSICDDCGETIKYNEISFDKQTWINFMGNEYNSNPEKLTIPKYFYLSNFSNWRVVKEIDNNVFEGVTNLTTIVIPDSVTAIGDAAFKDCDSLTTVNYTGTEEQWNEITIGENNEALFNATINCNYVIPTE